LHSIQRGWQAGHRDGLGTAQIGIHQEIAMSQFVLSFDLKNASSGDYTKAAQIVGALGFSHQTSGQNHIELPTTTFMGTSSFGAAQLRDAIRQRFTASGLTVVSLYVGQTVDWAAWGNA
jgi:hypothetical protein